MFLRFKVLHSTLFKLCFIFLDKKNKVAKKQAKKGKNKKGKNSKQNGNADNLGNV